MKTYKNISAKRFLNVHVTVCLGCQNTLKLSVFVTLTPIVQDCVRVVW